ncbi:hypothetical protein PENNAL_c0064G01102 [Penicillium nalgiovense]|uniref:DUF202 domain-containing protein n=1 Tax=Penicillium nalgiovense TaxID=60175 RepID=A0A1V6XNT4_PENNA|nr:hypothetical protein PENNAL_c0064G01102 [Penicillium nalgiovense]
MSQTVTQIGGVRPPFNPLINPVHSKPVLVEEEENTLFGGLIPYMLPSFEVKPGMFYGRDSHMPHSTFYPSSDSPVDNLKDSTSDARDHCANERTFLSWLRLSMYLAVVSLAIIISFHFRDQPTSLERRMSLPLGIIFWLLSLTSLANGFANYSRTVKKYARKTALVQSGWKTQVIFTVVGTVILGSCILFLSTDPAQ